MKIHCKKTRFKFRVSREENWTIISLFEQIEIILIWIDPNTLIGKTNNCAGCFKL